MVKNVDVALAALTVVRIRTFNLASNEVKYDKEVEDQIQQQQMAVMRVRIAIAKEKEAEQDAITVAEQGKADAARAKWEQERENATVIAKAEGRRRAEEQNAIAAKFYRAITDRLGSLRELRVRPANFRRGALLVGRTEAKCPEPFSHVRSARTDGSRYRTVSASGCPVVFL